MNIRIFGYTVELHISKGEYSRRYAGKLLTQSHSFISNQLGYKVALIKALRIEQGISLVDAKEAIESMFDFDGDGKPTVK